MRHRSHSLGSMLGSIVDGVLQTTIFLVVMGVLLVVALLAAASSPAGMTAILIFAGFYGTYMIGKRFGMIAGTVWFILYWVVLINTAMSWYPPKPDPKQVQYEQMQSDFRAKMQKEDLSGL